MCGGNVTVSSNLTVSSMNAVIYFLLLGSVFLWVLSAVVDVIFESRKLSDWIAFLAVLSLIGGAAVLQVPLLPP